MASTNTDIIDIVGIHGAGGGAWEYYKWKSLIEEEGNVFIKPHFINLEPNFSLGLSLTSFEDYVAQVKNYINQNCLSTKIVLIGASMGGIISLKLMEILDLHAIILVGSAIPRDLLNKDENNIIYPSIMEWSKFPISETIASLPDGDTETHEKIHKLWRDESGKVLNEIINDGIDINYNLISSKKNNFLFIIPNNDDTIPMDKQIELATKLNADIKIYQNMSHIGPLLSINAKQVAKDCLRWIEEKVMNL